MRCNDDKPLTTVDNGKTGRTTTVSIQHIVGGSLVDEPGDRVLSVTTSVSQAMERICATLAEGVNDSHASFYVMTPLDTGVPLIAHVQGAMTVFGNGVRSYATRAVYECGVDDLEKVGGYAALLPVLDRMRSYEKVEFDASDERRVEVKGKRELTADERTLYEYMAYCIVHDVRLFIRLGDDEWWRADEVRQSKRLEALLHAIDHIPTAWRDRASLAFSVEGKEGPMQELMPAMRFIAHHDDIEEWSGGADEACMLDWTSTSIRWVSQSLDGTFAGRPDVSPCMDEVSFLENNVPVEASLPAIEDELTGETPKSSKPLNFLKSLFSKRKK